MTVANIVIFLLGFFVACLLGLVACRLVWVRAVRLTRARVERDRPETLRAFEARIAGAQARAAVSIRELERTVERERQISSQARLMADQMTSSSALAVAERDDTQSSLVNLSDTLNETRERLGENEAVLAKRNLEIDDLKRQGNEARQEILMRDEDITRLRHEVAELRAQVASLEAGEDLPKSAFATAPGGADIASSQIEEMRESMRQLRSERNSAEASAARARLLLDARDDSEALSIARADFEAQRNEMATKIDELEEKLRKAQRAAGPQLVSVDGVETGSLADNSAPSLATSNPADLEQLRQSIDAMTASLTANAAMDLDAHDRINALLDEADSDDVDSNLVTSLVAARERLRSKGPSTAPAKKPAAKARATKRTRKTSKDQSTAAEARGSKNESSKISAATANGSSIEKAGGMPRASENDLKVI